MFNKISPLYILINYYVDLEYSRLHDAMQFKCKSCRYDAEKGVESNVNFVSRKYYSVDKEDDHFMSQPLDGLVDLLPATSTN
ncbi:hypothetical protein HanRHA438_Chr09g0428681 [Helianthus annuus]|nr:hypothetical protein HanRHA438_Chr09g0428681 [Helianthus annuus]